MSFYAYYEYTEFSGEKFFTCVLSPSEKGKFPTVIVRSPYVKHTQNMVENEIVQGYLSEYSPWLERGYCVVFQHCRGQGKSSGEFVPYIHEREDGLALRQWVRGQSFYSGEIFLLGGSYTASVHYATAPFESDVKGAVLEVQDTERYRLWYRNGQMRKGHANWHFSLYKDKCNINKNFSMSSFSNLPLENLSQQVLGERACDFEEMLKAEHPDDSFWDTRYGGNDARNATDNANIPILFTTGYNDFYVGGMFKMWNRMSEKTRENCAMLVSPYNHGDSYDLERGLGFREGSRREKFGSGYQIDWFDNIRTNKKLPYEKGVITYYRTFEDRWGTDFCAGSVKEIPVCLSGGEVTFCYDRQTPVGFSEEGTFQTEPFSNPGVVSVYTEPLGYDVFVKGQMKVVLTVSSDCPDTTFYVNVSIKKKEGDYTLRHDITSLCYQLGDYKENSTVQLNFSFDEHAFLLSKDESLRIDIAGTDNNTYVCHTNRKGKYYLQTDTVIAHNKVNLDASYIILPVEE